jgi:hypothetical protein
MSRYQYRLIFPTPSDTAIENTHTARIESEQLYTVGDELEHDGKRWTVTKAPTEDPESGSPADLMVWPAA